MKIGNLEVYGVIYKITNKINKKVYIGQTTQRNGFDERYRNNLENNTHNNHLKKSIKKYGIKNFEINKIFDVAFSKIELDMKEMIWISLYNSTDEKYGYNKDFGGSTGIPAKEVRKKMSDSQYKIPIVQIDIKGNFIKEWSGARKASKELKNKARLYMVLFNKR